MTTNQSPEAIEQDIRETQNTISDTVEALQERFSPRSLMNSLIGDEADGSDKLVAAARTNPIAIGLIGAGALMLASGRTGRSVKSGLSSLADRIGGGSNRDVPARPSDPHHASYLAHMNAVEHRDAESAESYRRRRDTARANYFMLEQGHEEDESAFRQRLDQASDTLRQKTSSFGDALSEGGQHLSDGASSAATSARDLGRRASAGTERAFEQNPMVGGLIAAAVGAILGAVIPDSHFEDETLGSLGDQARDAASDLADKGQAKAAQLAERGKEKVAAGAQSALDKADASLDDGATRSGSGVATPDNAVGATPIASGMRGGSATEGSQGSGTI